MARCARSSHIFFIFFSHLMTADCGRGTAGFCTLTDSRTDEWRWLFLPMVSCSSNHLATSFADASSFHALPPSRRDIFFAEFIFFCQRRNFFFTEQTEHGTRYRPPTCLVRHTSISFRSLAVARLYSDGAVRYPRYPGHSRTNTRAHGDVHRTRCLEATMPFLFPPFVVSAIRRFR